MSSVVYPLCSGHKYSIRLSSPILHCLISHSSGIRPLGLLSLTTPQLG